MINFILQPGNMLTAEKFCVTTGQYKSQYVPFDKLGETKYDGFPVPLGSVEYTHEFCKHRNIPIPPNISYPDELQKYLHRSVWKDVYENVDDDLFVKPQATKIFTGDIKENIDVDVDPQCPVWVSDPLSITTEIRYYILNKKCMGFVQYDQFDENVDGKDYLNFVDNILASYTSAPVTYTIDIGFTNESNLPFLIECNDAYAFGFYPSLSSTIPDYVVMHVERWKQIDKAGYFSYQQSLEQNLVDDPGSYKVFNVNHETEKLSVVNSSPDTYYQSPLKTIYYDRTTTGL